MTVHKTRAPVVIDLPGRTNAYYVAQVRARVDGIVQHRGFTEGDDVKEGQRLYKIDPTTEKQIANVSTSEHLNAKIVNNFIVDPDASLDATDRSFPAFWLPFQDVTAHNHSAQWVEQIVSTTPDGGTGGSDGGPACGEVGEKLEQRVTRSGYKNLVARIAEQTEDV